MTTAERIYTLAMRATRRVLPLLARGEGKLARGVRGRRGASDRLTAWAARSREPGRPLVWFHAPSVGEGLQAAAVIDALRELRPDTQIAYTFFSPSAERLAERIAADVADYLPLDLPDELRPVLDALSPDALVFSKTEVWPVLSREAANRGIPVLLLNATLPPSSSRLRTPARLLLSPAHARLTRVGAIAPGDAERFRLLGVSSDRLVVTGDARFDQVARRAAAVDRQGPLLAPLADLERLTIVAGSTWPEDEDPLVAAFGALPDWSRRHRMIIAPHEPTEPHLRELERNLNQAGIEHVRLGARSGDGTMPPVIVVDRVGILGELYALADVAYVGGGFGGAGLHSVLEPAAFGAPVLFGPRHANAREAGELVEVGGAYVAGDRLELSRLLVRLLTNAEARRASGLAARNYVEEGVGAARRGAELVAELLE